MTRPILMLMTLTSRQMYVFFVLFCCIYTDFFLLFACCLYVMFCIYVVHEQEKLRVYSSRLGVSFIQLLDLNLFHLHISLVVNL